MRTAFLFAATCASIIVAPTTGSAGPIVGSGGHGPFVYVGPSQRSGCIGNNGGAGPGFTCNIFETNNEPKTETPTTVPLPDLVTAGYLVLLETAASSSNDIGQWSDIAWFQDRGDGFSISVRFFSDPLTFPTLMQIQNSPNVFITEIQTGVGNDDTDVTVFNAVSDTGTNTYNFHSGAPINDNDIPEPTSSVLAGTGLLSLLWFVRHFRK